MLIHGECIGAADYGLQTWSSNMELSFLSPWVSLCQVGMGGVPPLTSLGNACILAEALEFSEAE